MVAKVDDHLFEPLGGHLAMTHYHARIGHHAMNHVLQLLQLLNTVVDKEDLPVAREFEVDGLGNDVVVQRSHCGQDGISVGRRCGERAQVTRSHQRELQRTRDGRSAHRQRVHVEFHLLELVLDSDAKLLLLVHYQQPQVMELHGLADELVGADEDVDLALLEVSQQLLDFFGLAGAAQVIDPDGEVLQALLEGAVMLESQHRRRHQHGGLLAVGSGLEGGAHGNLGLAEAHIAADEAVHRLGALHIDLDGLGGR